MLTTSFEDSFLTWKTQFIIKGLSMKLESIQSPPVGYS